MTRLLAIAAVAAALIGGASVASAETCMVKEQIPVPCEGNTRYAPGPVYGAPVYRAPVYQAPVYGGPVYSDYYYDDGYYGGYNDNYYYPSYGAYYGPSISFGFGFDGGRHHHGNFRRWHHRHH